MLKQDGTLCSFSLCIEQVQLSCETLRSDFAEIYGRLKYCSAYMKSVNGKWITRRFYLGLFPFFFLIFFLAFL
ncbi:hypothetical protein ES288_A04G195500v1 [Gossypium darwinii]|uniref:tRNA (adenine(58)-N(1))-methyltransferase catalytic subunit TRM61 C-terminal domain-containing protein n=1 Tax=Gossypium darwinii TaxID=34276 RepID=A0A5D2GYI8_GOSDA|nr:hypothetical protein ES288_A04G195500v1 [Gossypium darwinii]